MFKCEVCGKFSLPGEAPTRVVVETRKKVYPSRIYANDPGGVGSEIVREVLTHSVCAQTIELKQE